MKALKKYEYSKLIKMPYDYEDFMTDLWFQGCLFADIALDMKMMGLYGLSYTFEHLAKINLERLKVLRRMCK